MLLLAVLVLVAIWPVPPPPPPDPKSTAVPFDQYDRELRELVSFSREVLEKTDAIQTFEEQISQSAVPLPEATRKQWINAADRKRSERWVLCQRLVEKLATLLALERGLVDAGFRKIRTLRADEMDRDRRLSLSVRLAEGRWDDVKQRPNQSEPDVIAAAESLLRQSGGF